MTQISENINQIKPNYGDMKIFLTKYPPASLHAKTAKPIYSEKDVAPRKNVAPGKK